MTRLSQVPKAGAPTEVLRVYQEFFGERDPVKSPGTSTGTPGNYWTTFALVPDLMEMAYNTLIPLLQPGRQLDPQLRELVILRTAIVGDSKFEYSQHCKVARAVELPEEKIAAIKAWTTSNCFSQTERVAMAATDQILTLNRVEDETFGLLKECLTDGAILELFVVAGLWRMHGFISRALHLEYDNDTTERLTEIPAPTMDAE